MDWQPIETAPRDGRPVWARGWDFGNPDKGRHFGFVFWSDEIAGEKPGWFWPHDNDVASYVAEWMPPPPGERNDMDWQPIDTAPRDDTAVLVILPNSNLPHAARFRNGGWVIAWDLYCLSEFDQPTHWMPLPPPPGERE